jgi:catechol 2,3-dioxygenase-like lactoylglutathione lyase family enzyme
VTSFTVQTIDHVTVIAPSELEQAMLDWYSQTLGLERLSKPVGTSGSGGWFRAGATEIHVAIEHQVAQRAGHFGVVVDDFEKALDSLRRAGSHIEEARPIPGRRRCYTRDPAGNRVEILCYYEGPSA